MISTHRFQATENGVFFGGARLHPMPVMGWLV